MRDGGYSMTDLLREAVANTIEQHRLSIDQMRGIASLTIVVGFDEWRNVPRRVSIRPELVGRHDDERDDGRA